jgi:AraC-like DNA-binding protein
MDLSLADVSESVGASARQLQRVFREEAGEDFRTFLLRVRMEQATRLLTREPNPLPIHLVAKHVGYRQASGLRQAFLRFYGHNPSEIQTPPSEDLWREVNEP